MDLYKTFLRNNGGVLAGHILIYAQGIILIPLVIKTVGAAVYGGYVLALTTLGFVYGISSFGVGFKSARFLPAADTVEARRSLFFPQFWFQGVSIVCLSSVLVAIHPFLDAALFGGEGVFSKWLVFPYMFSCYIFSQSAAYFVATHRVKHFNFATVAFPYLNIAFILVAYFFKRELSVGLLLLTQIAAYSILSIPLSLFLVREMGFLLPRFNVRELWEDVRLGAPLRVNYVMDFLLGSSDRYMLAYFIGVVAVGYYNPGYALGSLIIFFPKVSGVVLPPLLSKAIDAGRLAEAYTMLNYTIKGFLLVSIPFVFGAAVMSGPLLTMFANHEVAQNAFWVTPVVALATLFFGLNLILSNALLVRMKTSILFKINVIAASVNLSLNLLILLVLKNILVAAFTTLIGYAMAFICIRRAVASEWPLDFAPRAIVRSIAASIFMSGALYMLTYRIGGGLLGLWLYAVFF